jgi:hypothetical protein
MWPWTKRVELAPLDELPIIFREEGESLDESTRGWPLTFWEFRKVRRMINTASSALGPLRPDHNNEYGNRDRADQSCYYFLLDDWLNDDRWQRINLCDPKGVTPEWFDAMRRVLALRPRWALSIRAFESGHALLFANRLVVAGEAYRGCKTFEEFRRRTIEWLELEGLLKQANDEILERSGPFLKDKATLELSNSKVTDRALASLAAHTHLKSLELDGTAVTDNGLELIQGLTNLDWLSLSDTSVSDDCLRHLKGMQALDHLWLRNTQITGTGLAQLHCLPSLKFVMLGGSPVDEAGLAAAARLPALESLEVGGAGVTNVGIGKLAAAPMLKELWLINANINGDGIRQLAASPNLRGLHLNETPIGDDDIPNIVSLPNLEELNLQGTKVTDACVPILERSNTLTRVDVMDTAVSDEERDRIMSIMGKRRGH